jgi:cyclohexyl-isocyanide hydratase
MSLTIGFLVYPDITQLDLTGPFEFLAPLPGAQLELVARDREPVRANSGLLLTPTKTLSEVVALDVLCVPGGPGQIGVMDEPGVLAWVREVGGAAPWVTSVCVGSLILGAAGLLQGYRAACHWASLDLLSAYGATPCPDRIVKDRNRLTGGGVTAGIDFGLSLAAELRGREAAERIQLALEYNPAPPFSSGHPSVAQSATVDWVTKTFAARRETRAKQAERYRRG